MKEAAQSSLAVSSQSANTGASVGAGGSALSVAMPDHQCCYQHHVNMQDRQHIVQEQLLKLQQHLQQAAGQSAMDSLQQVSNIGILLEQSPVLLVAVVISVGVYIRSDLSSIFRFVRLNQDYMLICLKSCFCLYFCLFLLTSV